MAAPDILTRLPPQNLAAERAILGICILDRLALPQVIDRLEVPDFFLHHHRMVYEAMREMFARNEAIDLVTLCNDLRRRNQLDEIGGAAFLAGLIEEAATLPHADEYMQIVLDKAMLRNLIRIGSSAIGYSYDDNVPVAEIFQGLERELFALVERQHRGTVRMVRDLAEETRAHVEMLFDRKDCVTGLSSGFQGIDDLTSGFQNGDMVVIAGRPSSGKTAFGLGIGRNAGADGKRTLIFSLEMSRPQLMNRLLAAQARVDWQKIRSGYLEPADWTRINNATHRLESSSLAIDDSARLTPMELRAKARRFQHEGGLDLVIIDYLQLMVTGRRAENRQQEVTEISRSIKAIAKELNVPILALSQLSRAVEHREKKEPVISDLRESGSLEQDADVIVLLYRPEMYGLTVEGESEAEAIIGKQRNGPIGRVPVTFLSNYATFVERSYRAPEPL